jgi:hypothetical protein
MGEAEHCRCSRTVGDQPVDKLRALRGAFGVGRGVGPYSIFRPRLFAEF